MPARRRGVALAVPALVASVIMVSSSQPAVAAGDDTHGLKAVGGVSQTTSYEGAKSTTGRLAQSDKALLKRTDSALVSVVVKLDFDATASYRGDVRGYAATSPRVTGKKLTGSSTVEKSYEAYTGAIAKQFRASVTQRFPKAKLGNTLLRVYGGVALRIPANQAKDLLALPNVAAVQTDTLNKVQTDSSTTFIGAPTIWAQEHGQALAGKGVIFGDLDTGVWPEHPSFADNPALGNPPAKADGTPRTCNFGDNPLTPATDVFSCNHKLIGGQPFLTTYNANNTGEVFPDSARDSGGHGTHTTSTAAGNIVDHASIFGIDRGKISGVAPGAWVIEYKVCGLAGCYSSDSAAAVAQAILDGVNVINFSISGGSSPFTDPVELAFLDAYDAGVTVAASAGNSGPGAATTDHHSPWVITVAASTQTRDFESTLSLTASSGDTATYTGASITAGVSSATPVVMASAAPYNRPLCDAPAPAGLFAGKIVACQRGGNGRVEKGFNVKQGGAAGMILFNPTLADTETDNHFLPAVHLADGTQFVAFMGSHTGVTATFSQGVKGTGQGDVMASFSSRGPGGLFLKPDITAPGVQILAGNTPVPDELASGPAGEYYQAIAGTSMSSPHIAGSAILLKALHPSWGPGAIKSALMTTANTHVVKEDTTTPADPFDDGSGRVDLTKAGRAPVVFEDSAATMAALGNDPVHAMEVNIPSINVPTMPGTVQLTRTAKNVSGKSYAFHVSVTSPAGSTIKVAPTSGVIKPGKSRTFKITITSGAPEGQYFGEIRLSGPGTPTLHLPVAFDNQQGDVSLSQSCTPDSVTVGQTTTCTVTAQNNSPSDSVTSLRSSLTGPVRIVGATGAAVGPGGKLATSGPVTLAGVKDGIPSVAPDELFGYVPLSGFGGNLVIPLGDETMTNVNVPAFEFAGKTFSAIGIDSNGYLVAGGGTSADNNCCNLTSLPNLARPNGVMAPFWTDLDGTGAPGALVNVVTDGVNSWIVVEWQANDFGTTHLRTFQAWIGVDGTEDVTYAYAEAQTAPSGQDFLFGAENSTGTAGQGVLNVLPVGDQRVTSAPGEPGESLSYTLTIKGTAKGTGNLRSDMQSDLIAGTTTVNTKIPVTKLHT